MQSLHINNNDFTKLPSSLYKLTEIKEITLDWLYYAQPSILPYQTGVSGIKLIQNMLFFCYKCELNHINFSEFVNYFSENNKFDPLFIKNNKTLLHVASEREETGVLICLI